MFAPMLMPAMYSASLATSAGGPDSHPSLKPGPSSLARVSTRTTRPSTSRLRKPAAEQDRRVCECAGQPKAANTYQATPLALNNLTSWHTVHILCKRGEEDHTTPTGKPTGDQAAAKPPPRPFLMASPGQVGGRTPLTSEVESRDVVRAVRVLQPVVGIILNDDQGPLAREGIDVRHALRSHHGTSGVLAC